MRATAPARAARRLRWRCGSRDALGEQQVVGGEILERVEALARLLDVEATIEIRHRLAEGEVTPRPGVRPGEVPAEEPLRRPLAETPDGDDPRPHLVVGQVAQRLEIEVAAGEPEHVLLLAPREAERHEISLAELGRARPRRER